MVESQINLKALNQFMKPKHFHLFHYHRMPEFLQPSDWMIKIDLHQAYYHLPIAQEHRCFLRISYESQLLQMTYLPFGLAAAPKMFASVTNWTAEVLRRKGLRLIVYLDDYLIVHQDRKTLNAQALIATDLLTSLGWNINWEKSILIPTQSIEFLGIAWDTDRNSMSLPPDKVSKIRHCLLMRLAAGSWTLKQAQRLLGHLNFATFITPRGRLHCRTLQRHSNRLQKSRHPCHFANVVREEMEWWLDNVSYASPIHLETWTQRINYVITDASDVQWGALVNSDTLKGTWSRHQLKWHCNLKDMFAVLAAISSKSNVLKNSTTILQCDNKTVVSYIKNEGGTRSQALLDLTKDLLALTDSLNIVLSPHHLPGLYNTEADHLSRNRAGSEWLLSSSATSKVFACWGIPNIDLFASKDAHVVSDYVTLDLSDLNACFHDAFTRCWRYYLAWVFPPPALMPRALRHLNSAKGKYIIIAPTWKKLFWQPDLKSRALARPMKIRDLETSLVDTATGRLPAQVRNLQLEAWLILAGTP